MAHQSSLASAITQSSVTDQVTIAKVYFSMFVGEHNLPLLATDHFLTLCKSLFLDSKIASYYSSDRTKTTCIVKHALVPALNDGVLPHTLFSVMVAMISLAWP